MKQFLITHIEFLGINLNIYEIYFANIYNIYQ